MMTPLTLQARIAFYPFRLFYFVVDVEFYLQMPHGERITTAI